MQAHQKQMQAFAKCNLEFNMQIFAVIVNLGDDVRKKEMGAFFGSIHATLNHILLADRIWLGRFASAFPAMTSLQRAVLVYQFASLRDELYADFSELEQQRHITDQVIVNWAAELTAECLAGNMRYRNSSGQLCNHPTWVAAAHMFNHQTHHRGQLTTLIHQLGCDCGVTDWPAFV